MVAKLKNEGGQSGGTGFDFRLHYMLHMLSCVHQGGIHVPENYFTYVTEHVAVVNMLHMPSYIHQGGWWWGCMNIPDEYFTYVTEHVAVVKCCQHVAHAVVHSSGGGGY